jgi:hypothetical protein
MIQRCLGLVPALSILLALGCSEAPKGETAASAKSAGPVVRARGEAAGLKLVLAVEGVDLDQRLVTLRGPGGNKGTYKVGPDIRRLSEIHAGDNILADYRVAAVAELREPTAEEEKAPLVLAQMLDRSPSNLPPGGTLARSLRAVVTIDALNATAGTVTLQGPLEGQVYAKVDDPSILSHLRVGQKVVVTFDETLVLRVEPGPGPK